MAPPNTVPKILAELTKDQILRIASEWYNLSLNKQDLKPALVSAVRDVMVLVEECDVCSGQCDPDTHSFPPEDYNVVLLPVITEQSALNNTAAGAAATLAGLFHNNNSNDVPVSDRSTNFVLSSTRGGSTTTTQSTSSSFDPVVTEPVLPTLPSTTTTQAGLPNPTPQSFQPHLPTPPTQQYIFSHPTHFGYPQVSHFAQQPTQPPPQPQQQDILLKLMEQQKQLVDMLLADRSSRSQEHSVPLPIVPPLDQRTRVTAPTQPAGRIAIQPVPNKRNAQFAAINTMPLMVLEGDINAVDMSKLKRKLVSGEHTSGSQGVVIETRWPHHCISRVSCQNPPSHDKLTMAQFFSGFCNKILMELDPSLENSELENKLRHLSTMADIAINSPWNHVLSLNASLFRCLEQAQLSWNSWDTIQDWLDKSLSQLKHKNTNVKPGAAPNHSDGPPQKQPRRDDNVEGIPTEWMKEQKICIMFQLDRCRETGDHKTKGGNTILAHCCAGCLKSKKETVSSHGVKSCPNKHLF